MDVVKSVTGEMQSESTKTARPKTKKKHKRPTKKDSDSDSSDMESRAYQVFRKMSRKKLKVSSEEREKLEKMVLGDGSNLLRNLSMQDDDSGVDDEGGHETEYSETLESPKREPAWRDDNDDCLVTVADVIEDKQGRKPLGLGAASDYQKYLRKKFTDVYGEPSWAKLDNKRVEDVDPDAALVRTSGHMIEKSKYLSKGVIDVRRLASLNCNTRVEGPVIKTVRFHPTTTVALVAGLGCTASLIQFDGTNNNKLAAVHFDKFPIRCARFAQNGNEFIVGSQSHAHFFTYDMLQGRSVRVPMHHNMGQSNMKRFEVSPDGRLIAVAGRFGQIHLMTADSKEWVGTMAMNGSVETICFGADSKTLYTYGDQGEVYVWDVPSRRLAHKFHDEGSIKGVSLAISPCSSYVAAGSASGVVNVYETSTALRQSRPTPLKAVMNLVTSATTVTFNHSSQILAIASDDKENAVKLVHLPSMTVFTNFPGINYQLNRVQDVDFSPSSGYFSVANNRNTAVLFRLKHFGNY